MADFGNRRPAIKPLPLKSARPKPGSPASMAGVLGKCSLSVVNRINKPKTDNMKIVEEVGKLRAVLEGVCWRVVVMDNKESQAIIAAELENAIPWFEAYETQVHELLKHRSNNTPCNGLYRGVLLKSMLLVAGGPVPRLIEALKKMAAISPLRKKRK